MIALVIIHNHRFDQNYGVLDRLYGERFSEVFHLVPFYDGDHPRVIPVFENSHCFQGYVAQGVERFAAPRFSHYCFIADDLILNPRVSADNLLASLGISATGGFFEKIRPLHDGKFWGRTHQVLEFKPGRRGSEGMKYLPSAEEAAARLERLGVSVRPLRGDQIWRPEPVRWTRPATIAARLRYRRRKDRLYPLPYPLLGSYADYFVVPAPAMRRFAFTCGVFASLRLFVEIALPTAMALTVDEIATLEKTLFEPRALWTREAVAALEERHDRNLDRLMDDFPSEVLYYHPVKLSRWRSERWGEPRNVP